MQLSNACLRPLGPREQLLVFAIAVAVFVFPIIQADYSYYDDVSRTLFLGEKLWRSQGRLFMELAQTMASFNTHSIDVFPLTLFLVLPLMALALRSLCKHYFPHPCLLDTQVVIPLLYTPFILGILSYQYDGPMVLLGICCAVFAITFEDRRAWLKWGVASILLAAAAGLYQTTLQIFVGLCCIDCIRFINEGVPLATVVRALVMRIAHLLSGLLLYGVTAFQFYTSPRGGVARMDGDWNSLAQGRIDRVFGALGLFANNGNRWLFVVVGLVMLVGLAQLLWSIISSRRRRVERLALVLLCVITLFTIMLAVPGPLLVIEDFSLGPRTLIAFACVTVLVFYLARNVLRLVNPLLSGLLIIPIFAMLSFSYTYGRVLVAQKAFEMSIVYSISHDLSSNPQLRSVEDFYLLPPESYLLWVPGSVAAVMEAVPAMKFMLTLSQITTSERFATTGINNVATGKWNEFHAQTRGVVPAPIVSTRFYDITRIGDAGFILLKAPEGSARYKYREFR